MNWPIFKLNKEHFTFHLQYKHSGTFADCKYEEQLTFLSQESENVWSHSSNPIIVNPVVKMWPHPAAHSH